MTIKTIRRQEYSDKINKYLGKGLIIVITGQRRVGKSCILKQLYEEKSVEADSNVVYIDKEKREFDFISNYRELNAYLETKFDSGKHNYILIDEVQDIKGFEHTIRSFHTEPETDVVITGSNAHILSGELSTIIGGRYKEIYVQPLSYTEFLLFHGLVDGDDALAKYIQFGGLPGLRKIGLDGFDAAEYVTDIYHTVLLKDVIMRNQIRNVVFLENLVTFLADNNGKLISANNISKFMKSQGMNITSTIVINYMAYLAQAFIIRKVNRYDIHGKRIFETNDKYYFEDNGIRNAIVGGNREGDIEKVIENIVCQHLIRSGYRVFVGQLRSSEIDFVCVAADGRRAYVQAAYLIADESTRKREFGNLKEIKDNYPKFVVSMTPLVTRSDCDGIVHLGLRTFLRSKFVI